MGHSTDSRKQEVRMSLPELVRSSSQNYVYLGDDFVLQQIEHHLNRAAERENRGRGVLNEETIVVVSDPRKDLDGQATVEVDVDEDGKIETRRIRGIKLLNRRRM